MNLKLAAVVFVLGFGGVTTCDAQATQPSAVLAGSSTAGQPLQPASPPPSQSALTENAPRGVAADAPAVRLVREGTHLTNRTGRLSHATDGQAIFSFDSDGKTQQDPPMIIQPNLKLQTMESVVIGLSKDAHFRVSGTVTEYKGKNFILLDKAVVAADVDQQM